MKKYLLIYIIFPFFSFGQLNMFQVEELDSLQYVEPRPVLFFVHTEWCSICLSMINNVLHNEEVTSMLNQKYYTVLLDAEYKNEIVYKGKRYSYIPSGVNTGKHELAMKLARKEGSVSFPSTVVLKENTVVFKSNGFIDVKELVSILQDLSLIKVFKAEL